ncbi:MAG: hypothetical protein FJZ00_14950 [Candidatus Sericytochromatia bacterium]|uniref:Uncharacterized protein n=1 Tax=Candidatus Tanganyikabacteria bacterium TaxID=2961651 RepID=A0A937XA88_9BACT|nr:hypothetical protein [Candidatus Tanganyikabacteria bacterium]
MSEKLLTHEEVQDKTRQFQALLNREKELQTFLLKLKMTGDDEQVREKMRQHDDAIAEIRKLRHEGMLPILKELNDFIKAAKAEQGARKGA